MNTNRIYNEQYAIVNGVSNYQGKIKGIMNKCAEDMKKAEHMYNKDYVWQYQSEILNKALEDIGNVMQSGYELLGTELAKQCNALPKDNPNPVYGTNDLVRMQILQMRFNCMTDEQIEKYIDDNISDVFVLDIAKNELMNRSKSLEGEQKALRQAEIRGMQPITNEFLVANAKKAYQLLGADVNNVDLLWGMSVGERASVYQDGGVRQHILKLAGVNEPIQDEHDKSKQFR